MTAQQLKNSILQMAVQGKLVPQDPNDEPASVLLERIRTEKEQLIKEKKIKREKNPSVIFKGADNTPYEKIGDEVRSLADEVPFDIPDSWEWVRLGSICEIARGGSPRPIKQYLTDAPDGVNWIKISDSDIGGKYINRTKEKIVPEGVSKSRLVHKGDFLLTNSMSFGRPYILNVDGCIHDGWLVLSGYDGCYEKDFLYYMLSSRFAYYQFCDIVSGAVVKNLNSDKVAAALFPLPPRPEQLRIVKAIENVEPLFSDYDHAERNLTQLGTGFPKALKKSILQEAVQGKLVPQDPSDEPAEALLERIRAEKQRLIKEGKIKKDKHESVIFRRDNSHYEKRGSEEVCIDEEIPFEIPENWTWARLSSFGVFSSGKTPSMSNPQFWNGNIPWVTSKDMKRPVITDSEMHISELAASSMQLYPAGTLLLVARSGILKRLLPLCKLGIDSTINQDIKAFSLYDIELSEWLFYGIKAFEPYILKELVKSVTTVESLKFDEFSAMLIPVPPLSEQKRIIAAIKAAMNLLTPLSSNPLFSL